MRTVVRNAAGQPATGPSGEAVQSTRRSAARAGPGPANRRADDGVARGSPSTVSRDSGPVTSKRYKRSRVSQRTWADRPSARRPFVVTSAGARRLAR